MRGDAKNNINKEFMKFCFNSQPFIITASCLYLDNPFWGKHKMITGIGISRDWKILTLKFFRNILHIICSSNYEQILPEKSGLTSKLHTRLSYIPFNPHLSWSQGIDPVWYQLTKFDKHPSYDFGVKETPKSHKQNDHITSKAS
jgi:hypothetical protein